MLDGKIFFGATGTPIRKIALAKSALALAEPEPFTLANLITKSFTVMQLAFDFLLAHLSIRIGSYPRLLLGNVQRKAHSANRHPHP